NFSLLSPSHRLLTYSMKKLSRKIDTSKMKSPAFMMVLTAVGQYAFRRDDGVYVVPVGCLKD
ncbi:MAG: hypothetical protein J6X35_00170, partial [Bacteroidales bacterium]|nr:hypothetical protein [Bacteroidales bacterium]